MTYDDELYVLTMLGNRRNLYLANQMLNNLYHEWRRLPEAVKDGAPSVRTKRYKFERQLEQRQVVPVVFEAGCSLEDYMRYLALHTASGRIKTPVKFEVDGGKADEVTIEQALDFSYMTVREALELVCDSCGGHYRLKGSRVTIVPRELETRTYKVTYDALRAFSLGRKPKDWKEQRAKADKTAITDERALAALKEARIHFPSTGVVSYDAKQYTLQVHTSQQGFRNLDALHIYLVLMQDK